MSYKKLFSFVFFFLLSTLFITSRANAAVPVTGWAWSSNIGWILFDTGKLNPVEISTTTLTPTVGKFSGYAWSSNIGWISFNSTTNVDLVTGKVDGFIRACAGTVNGDCTGADRSDGWDGWIELSGTNHTSPTLNGTGGITISTTTGVFTGYAWGGDVVGWVQFLASCPGCKGAGTTTPTVTITANINAASTTISSGASTTISWWSTNADSCTVTKDGSSWTPGTGTSNAVSSGVLTTATPFALSCTKAGLTPATDDVTVNIVSGGGGGSTSGDKGQMWVDNSASFATTTKVRAGGKARLNWLLPTGYAGCVGKNVTGMSKSLPGWENMSITSEKPNGSPYLTSVIPDIGEYKVYVNCGSVASSTNSVRIIVTDPTIIEI